MNIIITNPDENGKRMIVHYTQKDTAYDIGEGDPFDVKVLAPGVSHQLINVDRVLNVEWES